ncbi:MAG: hypothetical protein II975_00955 [Bacteroidales bacterium]|nr:hypothetical protein [Bacteroidales bacterium]
MKRVLLFVLAVLVGGVMWAQSDSVTVGVQVQPAAPDSTAVGQTEPTVVEKKADSVPMEPVRMLSRRQQMKYFGHDFSKWFCEVKYLYGARDLAIGLNLSYLPNIWGAYVTVMDGVNAYWASAGVLYRFSGLRNRVDFQSYAGLVAGYGYGAEVGLRLARVNRHKKAFSWVSVSMGVTLTNYGSFVSCGLSLPFGVPTAALCVF